MPHGRTLPSAIAISLLLALVAWGCSGADDDEGQPAAAQVVDAQRHLSTSGFRIDSASFQQKVRPYERIPSQHTCVGAGNTSPPLTWSEAPGATKSLALIAEDVDHHTGNWVHWVLYNIPAGTTELPEGISTSTGVLPDGTTQGTNDNKNIGYNGPCPPPNFTYIEEYAGGKKRDPPHQYFFRLYALDAELGLAPGATKADLLDAMEGHVLVQANTMGKYTRPLQLESTRAMKDELAQTAIAGATPTPTP